MTQPYDQNRLPPIPVLNALNRLDLRLEGPKLRTHVLGA